MGCEPDQQRGQRSRRILERPGACDAILCRNEEDDVPGPIQKLRSVARLLLLALAAVAISCQAPIPPPRHVPMNQEAVSAMMRLPVIHIWMEVGDRLVPRGSAVVLDEWRLALSLHQLDDQGSRLGVPGGVITPYTIVACGKSAPGAHHENGPSPEDWAIIELDEPLAKSYPPALVDWQRPVPTGEAVYVVGFPYGDALVMRNGLPAISGAFSGHVIGGRIEPRPPHPDLPRDVLYIRWGDVGGEWTGVSGGAAAVWDETLRRPVIIGIMTGSAKLERGGTVAVWGLVARPGFEAADTGDAGGRAPLGWRQCVPILVAGAAPEGRIGRCRRESIK